VREIEGGGHVKNKWFIGVLVAVLMTTAGCSNISSQGPEETNTEPIIIDSETIGVAEEPSNEHTSHLDVSHDFNRSLKNLFPMTEGYKWLFIGTAEYASIEVLSKIDQQHPEVTELYIEGLVEDMSGLYLSDTSYMKQYSVFEHQLIRKFGPYESVVLKSPLDKGQVWENLYFDSVYGLFDARYLIREATDNMVVVEITPASPAKDGVPKQFKLETTYEMGKGISMENRVYIYENDGVEETFDFTSALYEAPTEYEMTFVSRYFSKNPYISSIYHKGYFDYAIREASAYQFLEKNKFRLSDLLLTEGYESFIQTLDKEDVRTVSLAENVLHIYADKMDDAEALIGLFINHYEAVIKNNEYILIDWFEEDTLEQLSLYNIENNEFEIPEETLRLDEELQAKVALMNDNGLSFYFSQNRPIMKPSSKYLTNNLYYLSSIPMQSYLTLLKQAYEKIPYYRDGVSTLTLDEIRTFLLGFEQFEQTYKDTYIGLSSNTWGEKFFHQYLKPTSMIYQVDNGVLKGIHETSLVHYKKTLQQLGDTKMAAVLSMVIELLEKNNKQYSKELEMFLTDYGVELPNNY